MELTWFAVAIAVVIAAVVLQHLRRQRRRSELHRWAVRNGLRYAANDPFATTSRPFALFQAGDGRKVENVVYGEVADFDVRIFDYCYFEETRDAEGHRRRAYRRFTCALARIPDVRCPRIEVSPETLATRAASFVGGRDLQFESDAFNRAFHVRAQVPRSAYALLDGRLMEWLLASGRRHRFEIVHDLLLVAGDRTDDVAELWELLSVLRGFRERVPSVVASLHPNHGAASPPLDRFAVPFLPEPADESGGIVPKWTL